MTVQAEERFQAEWRAGVSAQMQDMQVQIRTLSANSVSRADIASLVAEAVPKDAYAANHQALADRVTRIEGGWQRIVPWIGAGIGCISLIASSMIGVTGLILVLVFHGH